MSWQDRLRPGITLTSPSNQQFTASWRANDVQGTIRVGQFNVPLVDGTIAQPMGANGLNFPLTLYFDGPDHDTYSMLFLRSLVASRGAWTVVHPVYGSLRLQPLGTPTLSADPISSGNVTKVETSWLEVTAQTASVSTTELGGQTSAQVDTALASSGAQFKSAINTADAEAQAAAAATGNAAVGIFHGSGLGGMLAGVSNIQGNLSGLYSGIQNAFAASPVMDVTAAVADVQALMQLPALTGGDLGTKISAFSGYITQLTGISVPGADADSINSAVMTELFLTSAIAGAALSVTTTSPTDRDSSVQAINSLSSMFTTAMAFLESCQQASAGNPANQQYFAATGMWADLARLIGLAAAYLLRLTFDLKIAKWITLTRPRAVIDIVITEYGSLGEGDSNVDLFIASNGLTGTDVQILRPPRQVVVFV